MYYLLISKALISIALDINALDINATSFFELKKLTELSH